MSSGNDDKRPKLYNTKPKKSRSKQQLKSKDFSSPNPAPTPSSSSSSPVSVPTESFARRYRFVWPIFLTANLVFGGYLYLRTSNKDKSLEEAAATQTSKTTASTPNKQITPTQTVKVSEAIPEDQQRELFKWMLEEKRKFKSNDPEETKRINEEKAILEKFLLGKSIPSL